MLGNRYDVFMLVQAVACNPNGDPGMDNMPRQDDETEKGFITDVAIKSRIRAYVKNKYGNVDHMDTLISYGASLNRKIAEAVYRVTGTAEDQKLDPKKKGTKEVVENVSAFMCDKYFDVRTFGGVMTTGANAGQITGPVQIAQSYSVDPVVAHNITITRKAYTESDTDKLSLQQLAEKDAEKDTELKRTMGNKKYIDYGLFKVRIAISPELAKNTGFSEEDLDILLEALENIYEDTPTSSKMGMSVVGPIVLFKHVGVSESQALRGCAPGYKLDQCLKIKRHEDVDAARDYTDYSISVDVPGKHMEVDEEITGIPGVQVAFKKYGQKLNDVKFYDMNEEKHYVISE